MANINEQINKIRSSKYGDEIRSAIVDALIAINNASDYSAELSGIKETLTALTAAIDTKADDKEVKNLIDSANKSELEELKNLLQAISTSLNAKVSESSFVEFKNELTIERENLRQTFSAGLASKADVKEFNKLANDINIKLDQENESLAKHLSSRVTQEELNSLLRGIRDELNTFKSSYDANDYPTQIASIITKLKSLSAVLDTKANDKDVKELFASIGDNGIAELKATLAFLEEAVNAKPSGSEFNTFKNEVTQSVSNVREALAKGLSGKTDLKDFNLYKTTAEENLAAFKSDLSKSSSVKLNQQDFNSYKIETAKNIDEITSGLRKSVDKKTDQATFNDFKREIESRMDKMRSDLQIMIGKKVDESELNIAKTDINAEIKSVKDAMKKATVAGSDNRNANQNEGTTTDMKDSREKINETSEALSAVKVRQQNKEDEALKLFNSGYSGAPDDPIDENSVTRLRAYVNEQLSLKASQHDFDYIVGNGFQSWTITDYIIRIREDYNQALLDMATKTEAANIANKAVNDAKKIITVNDTDNPDTKISFKETEDTVELAEVSDIEALVGPIDGYFTFNVSPEWAIGGFDEHGWEADDEFTYRSDYIISRDFEATLDTAYSMKVLRYDEYKMLISEGLWQEGGSEITYKDYSAPIETRYIRLLVKKNNDSPVYDTTEVNNALTITMHGTDWTGQNDNKAMDVAVANDIKKNVSSLDTRATRLESRATALETNLSATDGDVESLKDSTSVINTLLKSKFDRVEYGEDYKVYFYAGEELVDSFGPIVAGSGTGGGGGGGGGSETSNNAVIEARNTSGFNTATIPSGASLSLSIEWSSIEDEMPTGDGTLTVFVNGTQRIVRSIPQGSVTFDASKYFQAGKNALSVTVTDVYENRKFISFTIYAVSLMLRSSFDALTPYEGEFQFPYTPIGEAEKTTHFAIDGTELETEETSLNNRQFYKTIPAQSHGSHTLEAWVDADVNGELLESDHLVYEFIAIEEGVTTPVIISSFKQTTVPQWTNIPLTYKVYDPLSLSTRVTRSVNGTSMGAITVDRTEQTWPYRATETGSLTLSVECRGVTKTFNITVEASEASIEAIEENLSLYLTASGRNNGEDHPEVWEYEGISATLTDFDYTSNGWVTDDHNNTVLRVSGDARVTIPYRIFERDFRSTGKTIELEFETRYVRNYDTPIISCWSGNRGIMVTAQRATLKAENAEISTQFKEEEHVRISFVVEKRSEDCLVYIYINGIISGTVVYPEEDDFSQINPVGITIGSNDCTVDLYCIRVYDNDLNRQQVLGNWIADTQDVDEMLSRYDHNNIFDSYGNIVIAKLPKDLPYMIANSSGTHMPQYKGDKVTISGQYVDQLNPSKSFTFTGSQWDVQGTSSQYYERKNYKTKFKDGIYINGSYQSKYAMNDNALPVSTFCFKKDVASSEGANNVELVRLYNDICPYKTPGQLEDSKVRQGIDGHPMVLFEDNGDTVSFVGKYNFNNDKSTENVFGLMEDDESWETLNNTSNRVIYKDDNFTGKDWLNDFEARYPDTDPPFEDPSQLASFVSFVKSTDTETATGDAITPVTYDGVTYSTDSADYRLAKFKNEIGNYVEMDSMLFYYLFTDIFLMVDSRAKNTFPSFMGSSVA